MYKIETHLHTSEISPCSQINAEEMVKLHFDAGYKTVFVSDHFKSGYFKALGDMPWRDKIKIFLSGFYKAKNAGEKLGVNVLMSAEISFDTTPNHYLIYGEVEDFLLKYPDLCEKTVEEFYELAKAHNLFVVQAHPYRDGVCYPSYECVDAFEIYNGNPRHNDYNDQAEESAEKNGLYITAGSDAHRFEDIGKSGVMSETEIKTSNDFIELVKSGRAKVYRGEF